MKLTHLLLGALLTLPLSASTQPPSGAELPVSIAEANPSTLVEAPTPTRNGCWSAATPMSSSTAWAGSRIA